MKTNYTNNAPKNIKGIFNIIKAIPFICIVIAIAIISGCSLCKVDADEEGVFVKQPLLFGGNGVDEKPLLEGSEWKVFTTKFIKFKVVPIRYDETFDDDAFSDDNTPLDVTAYVTVQINKGSTPKLIKNFGEDWFENNLRVKFRTLVRGEICKYSMYDLVSNRDCLIKINDAVYKDILKYTKEIDLPVTVCSIDVNKVKPNSGVLDEMNNTAVQIQAKQTQIRRREMEEVREKTEIQRAKADQAYRSEMSLSADQFIQLQWIEVAKEKGANIDVLMDGSSSPVWNIRRK